MGPEEREPLLGDSTRERLAELAEALIPGGSGMPSAVAAGTTGPALDRVLAARADLLPRLERAVVPDGPPAEVVRGLSEGDPEAFEALALVLSCAYVQSDAVRESLSYPGQVAVPIPERQEDPLDELLAPVRARGARRLPTPKEGGG
jgi:hypothetical protein